MTKSVRLNPRLVNKLRRAALRSGKSEAQVLRLGLEKVCDEILENEPPLEGEALKAFAESLIAQMEPAPIHPLHGNAQETEIARSLDARERANRRRLPVSPAPKVTA